VPVWVYRSETQGSGDVLAAVGPLEDGAPSALDRKIVELGSSLAARQGGRFHLVHAWSLPGESLLRNGRFALPPGEVDQMVEGAMLDSKTGIDRLLADTGVTAEHVTIHLTRGDAAAVIGELAAELRPSVVVMGTLARSGIAGLLIGNTAEVVLGSLDTGVLAVKPNGFVSPVSVM
jgi:nucleotide-binding universal stress UspA family protein